MARAAMCLLVLLLAACAATPDQSPVTAQVPAQVTAQVPAQSPVRSPAANATAPRRLSPQELAPLLDPRTQGLGSHRDLAPAIQRNLRHLAGKSPGEAAVVRDGEAVTWGMLRAANEELLALLPRLDAEPRLLLDRFRWLPLPEGTLLTGYYEPLLEASPVPHPDYPHPIYAMPQGKTLGKAGLPDREAIDFKGALKGRGLEIAWARDLVDVFFLHVQGSGRLRFPDGGMRHVLYAGTNGHAYYPVGRALIEEGLATREEMSMQTIRRIFAAHPGKVRGWMIRNPKYIFFRLAEEGPHGAPNGAMGLPLTPRASVAVNRASVPLGAAMVLDALLPGHGTDVPEPLRGVVLAQDTGAMHENQLDLFAGFGPKAEDQAGRMQGKATVYLLLLKSGTKPLPGS